MDSGQNAVQLFATKPRMFTGHDTKKCSYPMNCRICMERCYDDAPGHFFPHDHEGKTYSCACGLFSSLEEAKKSYGTTT